MAELDTSGGGHKKKGPGVKKGKNQMYAAFEVMKKYEKELKDVLVK